MGLPVTIYKSTDVGAPVGNVTKPSDWITILKKCLVEGYGDKLPLGWTLEYENAVSYAAVFRNNPVVGSGGYFQINSITGGNAVSTDIDIKVAKIMTGVDVFVDKLTSRRFDILSGGTIGWVIIGTARGFWMIQPSSYLTAGVINYGAMSACWTVFIGDIECFDPNDASPFTIATAAATGAESTTVATNWNIGSAPHVSCVMHNADGTSGINDYRHNLSLLYTTNEVNPNLFPVGSPMCFMPVTPTLNNSFQSTPTEARPVVRGNIPGLYWSAIVGGRGLTEFYHTFGSDTYRVVQGLGTPHLWLKTTGEWYV